MKAFTPTHSSVWAMIIWLWLGCIKRRPAKDSPEVKAEGRQSAAPPTCASKDRTEPNGTPQEAAICLWIPFQKKKKKITRFFDSIPNWVKSVLVFFLPPHTKLMCAACYKLSDEVRRLGFEGSSLLFAVAEAVCVCVCLEADEGGWSLRGGLEDCKIRSFQRISFEVKRVFPPQVSLVSDCLQSASDTMTNTMLSLCDANHAGICSIEADGKWLINAQILFQARNGATTLVIESTISNLSGSHWCHKHLKQFHVKESSDFVFNSMGFIDKTSLKNMTVSALQKHRVYLWTSNSSRKSCLLTGRKWSGPPGW